MNVKGRAKYEIVIVVIVVAIAIVLAVGLYSNRTKVKNDKILMNELTAMRTAVSLYVILNKTMPPSLNALVSQKFNASDGVMKPYLDKIAANKEEGKFIDPFGNPYSYDKVRGLVSSTTSGYGDW